jgi:hypothetical protein
MKEQKVNLSKFFADPDWVLVEEILRDCLLELGQPPADSVAPSDFKAQTLAKRKLCEGVEKFLLQAKVFTKQEKSSNPFI